MLKNLMPLKLFSGVLFLYSSSKLLGVELVSLYYFSIVIQENKSISINSKPDFL
jgi:hypothetical protein